MRLRKGRKDALLGGEEGRVARGMLDENWDKVKGGHMFEPGRKRKGRRTSSWIWSEFEVHANLITKI